MNGFLMDMDMEGMCVKIGVRGCLCAKTCGGIRDWSLEIILDS